MFGNMSEKAGLLISWCGLMVQNKKRPAKIRRPDYIHGGADQDRTDDLLNAIQALSQLSYSPVCVDLYSKWDKGCQYI
jgi:hypothetical protein